MTLVLQQKISILLLTFVLSVSVIAQMAQNTPQFADLRTEQIKEEVEILSHTKDNTKITLLLYEVQNRIEKDKDVYSFFAKPLLELLKTNEDEGIQTQLERIFSKSGKIAVPDLIDVLKTHKNREVLSHTIKALSKIGADSVPPLIEILKTNNDVSVLIDAQIALGGIGKDAKDAIPLMFGALPNNFRMMMKDFEIFLKESDKETHESHQKILKAKSEINKLTIKVWEVNIQSIVLILDDLIRNDDYSNNEIILESFEKIQYEIPQGEHKTLADKIKTLQARERLQKEENATPIKDFIVEQYVACSIIALVLMATISWLLIFLARPIWLVSFHEYLWTNSLMANFKHILEFPIISLVSTICLKPRTIDAWVKSNLDKIKGNFEGKETVKERNLYIPVKVAFKNDKNIDFTPQSFPDIFDKNQSPILIYGDGGSGKTSLVCQMANWALDKRLFEKHHSLPVLIENNVRDIQKTISLEIKNLTDSETVVSDALQKALLRKKRILLIVDGLSELDEETKRQILGNTDINAVVYTSRNDEIKDISKIETNNLVGGMVSDFLENYIEKSIGKEEKEKLFDKTIFDYNSGDLKKLVGEKEISVLWAKLYAEQMIAHKQTKSNLPTNVPDLMIQSIKILHEKDAYKKIEFSEVVKVSKIIAYESLKQDYRPIPAKKDAVKKAIESIKNGEELLNHLRDNLKIVEDKGIAEDTMAFKLDPLAEYLAASYLVEEHKDDTKMWKAFFKDAEKKGGENNIKVFLVAVKDWCEIGKFNGELIVQKLDKIIESQTDKVVIDE
jgi:NACHT domain